jgi:glyoxylase-like metal-dependent hydrolase (beta-lactamase superfamily II)
MGADLLVRQRKGTGEGGAPDDGIWRVHRHSRNPELFMNLRKAKLLSAIAASSLSVLLAGCASTTSKEPDPTPAPAPPEPRAPEAPPQPEPHAEMPDAEIIVTELDGVTVHTVMGPEEVLAVTSHVLETKDSLVVIDTQLTTSHSYQLRALCERLGKPILYLLVTHGHPDHYFGLVSFDDIPSMAFPSVRESIAKRYEAHQRMHKKMEGPLIPDMIAMPQADLEPGKLVVDDLVIRVESVRDAEDTEQALIRLPKQKAIIAQDLVSNGYHAFIGTGPVGPWVERLESLAAEKPEVVFAGHGPPGGAELLPSTADYLRKASELADAATTREGMIKSVLEAFPERKGPFLVEVGALIIFRDRKAEAPPSESPPSPPAP